MEDLWEKLLMAGIVVLVALVLRLVLVFVIKRSVRVLTAKQNTREPDAELGSRARQILTRAGGLASQRQKQRIATLGSLLRNVVDVVLVVITLLTVLAIFGVPMGPLIASAGVGGVALGFGAHRW